MAKPLVEKELNTQHKKFIKNVAAGQKYSVAADRAGFHGTGYGSYLMRQPKILTALECELEKQGIDDGYLVNKIKEGLEAFYVKKDGGQEYPDFHAIEKMIRTVLLVKKDIAEGGDVRNTQVNIILSPELMKGLVDSGKITDIEAEEVIDELQHEPVRE